MYKDLTDVELTQKTIDGEVSAFEELVNRYQKPIFYYCQRLLNNNHTDAEDATSEAMFKLYKNIAKYNPEYKFSSWLYRIAHNCAVNIIASKSKLFYVDIESFWNIPTKEKDESSINKYELEQILDKLNFNDKNVLILYYLEEKTTSEISQILNLSENTVTQRICRARAKARKILNKIYLTNLSN